MRITQCLVFVYIITVSPTGESITSPTDEYAILEEERRAAETTENWQRNQSLESSPEETGLQRTFLNSLHGGQGYSHNSYQPRNKEHLYHGGYELKNRQPDNVQERFHFSSSGHHGQYGGHSKGTWYPGTTGGEFGHVSGSGYGHFNGGGYGHVVHESHVPVEYEYHHDHGHEEEGSFHGLSSLKSPLSLKKILLPLAGIAILGAAAALAANPVLLQLGVISGGRRRRDITQASSLPFRYWYKNNGSLKKRKGKMQL